MRRDNKNPARVPVRDIDYLKIPASIGLSYCYARIRPSVPVFARERQDFDNLTLLNSMIVYMSVSSLRVYVKPYAVGGIHKLWTVLDKPRFGPAPCF